MMIALLLALALAQPDPVAMAAAGLVAQIEDDNGGPDTMMTSITSQGCAVEITGKGKNWALDMTKVEALALEDTFVYVAAPPHKLAIVGDASKPDQAAKLKALATALGDIATRCRPKSSAL